MNRIAPLVDVLSQTLEDQGLKLTTAESCTGGWIAKSLTDKAGSSAWFEYGFVSYSNGAKFDLLGVPVELIQAHGAVSEPVVEAMALGALDRSQADLSVAVSGVAGPDGGSEDKPVGTVWIGWGRHQQGTARVDCQRFLFDGDRDLVRRQTVVEALAGVLRSLAKE